MSTAKAELVVDDASAAARSAGNKAYSAGDLDGAFGHYTDALLCWERSLQSETQPKTLEEGQLVRYSSKGYFGIVMSCFPLFDEYFLKDLGSSQAIWAGDIGRDLRRFDRKELVPVRQDLVDFRLAVLQNLALVCLRQEKWDQTMKWADQALFIQGRSAKALMRKGSALLQMDQPGPASDVLATAAEEVPNDAEVRRLLREAEKKRSPMWVCATGCCGPWGIVCGGPVGQTHAEVVAPAKPRVAAESTTSTAEPESVAETTSTAEPERAQKIAEEAAEATTTAEPERVEMTERTETPDATAVAAPSFAKAENCRREVAELTAGDEQQCRARRPFPSAPPEKSTHTEPSGEAERDDTRLQKGVTSLLWVAGGAFLVAFSIALWTLSETEGGGPHR